MSILQQNTNFTADEMNKLLVKLKLKMLIVRSVPAQFNLFVNK